MSTCLPSMTTCAEYPRRIVCLTAETTEVLCLLGAKDRIAGVSGHANRPLEARNKPQVSAFKNANFDKILNLRPDLVLTFSDVQAEITRELVLRGITVLNFNQRSVAEILEMIAILSRIVGREAAGLRLVEELRRGLEDTAEAAKILPHRPRVYFEEWDDPLISGIEWVEELIEIAGGEVIFLELRRCGKAKDRAVDPAEVIRRDPEIILASWCGKKVDIEKICSRPGWEAISAVRNGHVYEIPSGIILQPGPASLTDGIRHIYAVLARVVGVDATAILQTVKK
jgi:iron complex transport system substrate-binding protein